MCGLWCMVVVVCAVFYSVCGDVVCVESCLVWCVLCSVRALCSGRAAHALLCGEWCVTAYGVWSVRGRSWLSEASGGWPIALRSVSYGVWVCGICVVSVRLVGCDLVWCLVMAMGGWCHACVVFYA